MLKTMIRFTARDYRKLPPEAPRVELLDGEFVVTPSPSDRHQVAVGNLYGLLRDWIRSRAAGKVRVAPFDVYLGDHVVVQPDVLFVRTDHAGRVRRDGVHGAPDLVIEVASPSTSLQDLTIKRELYRRAGVPEYWVVDPEGCTVSVYGRKRTGDRLLFRVGQKVRGTVLPEFRPSVGDIFVD